MGVTKFFERGVALHSARACLIEGGRSRSYREVHEAVAALAGALDELGGFRGEACAVLAPNCAAAFECMLAIYRAARVFVPLNSKNHVEENAHLADLSEARVLFFHSFMAAHAAQLMEKCPKLQRWVCIDQPGLGDTSVDELIARDLPPPPIPPEDNQRLVSVYGTGGTTGLPKGVMFTPLTWETMAANLFANQWCPEGSAVYLVITPITHAAGTIAKLLLARGATIIVQDGFDAQAVLDAIAKHRVTHLYLPPTAIYMLLTHAGIHDCDFSSLQSFMYASSPMSVQKLRECLKVFGPVMVQFWGQTEAPIFCTCLDQQGHLDALAGRPERLASCGQPMLLTPVAVMGNSGELLGDGERGELVVKGNLVMKGYYGSPEATAKVTCDGWHRTGDVGYRDSYGYYYIVDRIKDMIITGGFNVYPSEIEQVLWSHPDVKECAVIGVPDEKWGEAVKAVVELKSNTGLTEAVLQQWCKDRLGSIKTPKSIEFWANLPRTPVGKVDKKELRQQYWRGLGRVI
jgi:acyl-CoA synthetase (AMP-forming)/AMP-acid ligase II